MVIETRRSTCNRDCPDACGLIAEVENGRLLSLKGDPDHPVTRGFLCLRTSRFPEQLGAPHRLRTALIRRDGELRPASIDAALDLCAARLGAIRAESGPAAIFHYRSGGSLGLLKHLADRFFERFGPCTSKIGDICSGAGEAAQVADFGVSESNDLFDLQSSRHILLWGKNPTVSNVHLVPILKAAAARGARLTLIDPVSHRTRTLAHTVLAPRPGGDVALALGVGRVLFDSARIDPDAPARCDGLDGFAALCRRHPVARWGELAGVTVAEIEVLADQLADGPTAILVGWGMGRRRNGGALVRALDALSAITGNLFQSGGGCSFYFKRRGAFESAAIATGAMARAVREPCFGADVLAMRDPPIRAIWVTAGNPVCMLPDSGRVAEALERTEFVVVVDPFLTDTARRADVVFPVPTLLEDSDVLGAYGHHWLAESRPLVDAPEGVPHELEILQGLAARLGLAADMAGSIDDWKRRLLARVAPQGASLEDLRAGPVRNPEAKPVLFADGRVHTPNGKVQLMTELDNALLGAPPTATHPLWLFSNSTIEAQAAQWSRDPGDHLPVTVHPDVAPDGATDGDLVRVENERGSIVARLRLDPTQRTDVAILPKGGHFDRGQSANTLIEAVPTDIGLGAAYLDCHVRLVRSE